ncbi:apolipoprotein N-acyltransferase [Pararhizobium mangrovi]|uniref:Apolipoprotein N-acyltransferase n=1 Tax=Pararhizobium mangrovi TaxID=2590452 RepID=A0A506U6T4_9HYPH|nr:apolipoprotein N-acyltransferase [Pararhizobium mangrovi]TPW28329.1 apolipoprotein N-acyltransferase [Pararhizobium mangrovi]
MEGLAGRIMLLSGFGRILAAMLAGAFAVFALAPFDFPAAPFVSFAVLVWLIDGASGRDGAGPIGRLVPSFWIGWWFGFGYFLAGLWWVGSALLVEADQFAWALPIAVLGLPALLAFFYAFATLLARCFWSDGLGRVAALAFAFGLAEWLRTFVLTGFPWNAIGYAAMPVPTMMQSAHLVGLLTLNALAVFVYAVPASIATRRGAVPALALAGILVVAHIGYGAWVLADAPAVERSGPRSRPVFRIVQPSVNQAARMTNDESRRIFETYLRLSALPPEKGRPRPDYIVWPETALPFLLSRAPGALDRIGDMLKDGQTLITGAVREAGPDAYGQPRYANTIDVIDDTGKLVAHADKVHLVPFGEYMPFEHTLERLGVSPVAMPGGFTAGKHRTTLRLSDTLVALPLVCYEIIFPGPIRATGPAPDFLLNVTNDAWYGDTTGPPQHLRQARLRAVETGLPLVRAGNNGISVVTDGYGRVVAGMRLDATGILDATLPAPEPGPMSFPGRRLIFYFVLAILLITAIFLRKDMRTLRD